MRVEVYWNLRKNCYSVRDCSTGRVVEHTNSLWIRRPEFVVRRAGREKVLRDKQKNVHAFVRGCLLYTSPSPRDGLLSRMPSSA